MNCVRSSRLFYVCIVCVYKYDCTHARVIKTYLHDGFFFYPSVNQKKKRRRTFSGVAFNFIRRVISLKKMFKAGVFQLVKLRF